MPPPAPPLAKNVPSFNFALSPRGLCWLPLTPCGKNWPSMLSSKLYSTYKPVILTDILDTLI